MVRDYIVQSGAGKGNEDKVTLEAREEDTRRRCESDEVWHADCFIYSRNREGSVADGRQSSAADDQ